MNPQNRDAGIEEQWAEVERLQNEKILKEAEAAKKEATKEEAAKLFHKLWGQAIASPDYVKAEWGKMQLLLDKLGIPV